MTDVKRDAPNTFKYSIWDTRTSDYEPNIKVESAEAAERSNHKSKQRTEDKTI